MPEPSTEPRLPLVAIVGRPNVGKSSLFNRLTGQRRAIVTDEPGITRDRLYGRANWRGASFEVVDTGGLAPPTAGLVPGERAALAADILRQAQVAIAAAAKLVLVVDARTGPTPLDAELARGLRRTGKPLVLAVNKVDAPGVEPASLAFHELGIAPVIPVSAEHGLGVDALLDELVQGLAPGEARARRAALSVAIIGRPNVGKSTLVNRLLGEERVIVSPEPGTTRDAVDSWLREPAGQWWRLVDTAGIRRKGKTKLKAEKLSVVMARKHLERADLAVLLVDATEGATQLDAAIAGYAHQSGRSLVLGVNKWDAVGKPDAREPFTQALRCRLKFLDYAPLVFLSALTGQGVGKLLRLVAEVGAARRLRIPAAELAEFARTLAAERATVPGGRPLRVHALRQVAAAPPVFEVTANLNELHFSVERFLENQLRARWAFVGTPIRFRLRRAGRRRLAVR